MKVALVHNLPPDPEEFIASIMRRTRDPREIEERQGGLKNLQELADKGVPLELVRCIHALEFESGEEFTSRIKTVEAHNALTERKKNLENVVDGLEKKRAKAEKDFDKLTEDINFQTNELDAEREKTRT